MPATAEPTARGFALSDFDRPDVGDPEGATGPVGPSGIPGERGNIGLEPETGQAKPDDRDITGGPLVDDTKGAEPGLKADPDHKTLMDAMDAGGGGAARQSEEERATAEKEAAAAAEKAKAGASAAQAPAATERDADLKVEVGPHVQPKTRKIIEGFEAKTRAARDERDKLSAERDALRKERDDMAERAKTAAIPTEIETELKSLRERVRELDITKDPVIEAKYDKRIAANSGAILATLKSQGFGTLTDPETHKEIGKDPAVVAKLLKDGLTHKNLQPYVAELEKMGLIDEAEAIRDAVRENVRISREKQAEIESWKGNYEARQKERAAQGQQQQERRSQDFRAQTESTLKADLATLAKDFAYINAPAAPLATDAPATQKAKEAALAEYNAAAKQIETAVKSFDTTGVAPEKLSEVVGKINSAAIQAVVLKTHVLPRVIKDLAAKSARIAELEGELGKIRGAGSLSRRQSAPSDEGAGNNGKPVPATLEQAMLQARGE